MISKLLKNQSLALVSILILLNSGAALSQNLLDDATSSYSVGDTSEQFTEAIDIISRSGKIFILTNNNQQLNKGDFITMSLREKGPVARAIVAKNHKGRAGIKVIKVYSLSRWKKLAKGTEVDIIRGDDSVLFKPKVDKKTVEEDDLKITSEEDLFNDKEIIEGDADQFYTDKRHIKPDNVVSIGYSQFSFVNDADGSGDTITSSQFSYNWAYQFSDNYWVEGTYARAETNRFPRSGEQTVINSFSAKVKYTIKAPLYSYLLPYAGFQTYIVSSANAGVVSDDVDEETAALEEAVIDDLEKTQLIVGVSFMRRLVPGWFFKADLGNDIFSAGFAIEF